MVTAACPIPATAQKTPRNQWAVAIAMNAEVVLVEASILHQVPSVVER
jgi:hypothetical protein